MRGATRDDAHVARWRRAMGRKLYIYDRSSWEDRMQANGRFTMGTPWPEDILTVAVESEQELINRLDGLVRQGAVFDRALFQTHGDSGGIYLGETFVNGWELAKSFGRHWMLFSGSRAKIYFDGCNVAQDPDGWDFLIAAGQTLLRSAGGYTLGYTSMGSAMPGFLPFIGGHTVHFYGQLRVMQFGPGGLAMGQPPTLEEALVERA